METDKKNRRWERIRGTIRERKKRFPSYQWKEEGDDTVRMPLLFELRTKKKVNPGNEVFKL
uniref:Uncharacterized protein n=1 Tax=Nelumbo nucifera TaxID=4432 RepID=A0A822ZKM6_NELNU|nr:TPA_asm: hypothetical protein HUJ06_002215 [Nelumbo nucifera]